MFADQWMEYRYGIMPLVYSLRDAQKALDKGTVVKDRKVCVVQPKPTGNAEPSSFYYYTVETEGTVKVAATAVQRFSSISQSRMSTIGFNPLVTAWELIPYSFVFDWFVNVGDYINIHTTANFSDECNACISQRDSITRTTKLVTQAHGHTPWTDMTYSVPWAGNVPVRADLPAEWIEETRQVVRIEQTEGYTRTPIDIRAVPLVFKPSLSWRRLVDGAVLSTNLFKQLVSRFKRR